MRLDPAPLCLRNDGGTLWHIGDQHKRWDLRLRICDVCGDKYTVDLLGATIKSTWEALRLGLMPLEHRGWGDVRLSVAFGERGPVTTETTVGPWRVPGRLR